jgi:hypothetical protein
MIRSYKIHSILRMGVFPEGRKNVNHVMNRYDVKDKLPEQFATVLVWSNNGVFDGTALGMYDPERSEGKWRVQPFWDVDFYTDTGVDHWFPIPSLYKDVEVEWEHMLELRINQVAMKLGFHFGMGEFPPVDMLVTFKRLVNLRSDDSSEKFNDDFGVDEVDPDTFGAVLRSKREHRGWTMKELGRRTGYSLSYISKVETGARRGSHEFVAALATALADD